MTLNILNTEINCIGYSPKAFYFRPGQAFFIHIKSSTNSYLNSCDLELDLQSEQLPLNLDTNRIGLGFNIYFPFRYNSMVIYDFESYLSDIGGFYGSIEGFFASIFGSGKLGPWGIAQTIILTSIPCVRSLEEILQEYMFQKAKKIKYFADSRKELNKKEVPDEEKAEEQIIADDDEIKEIHS
ncbi:unnamed protein product [Rhizophagus irregularis]|nr:unnamed protein product [Rhizophagus irregularis]